MQAHKVIEMLKQIHSNSLTDAHKFQAELLIRKVTDAVKFEFDFGEFPVFSPDEMDSHIDRLRLPCPLCYFEIPTVGALLAVEINDSNLILIHPFIYGMFGSKKWGTWPVEILLAIDKDAHSVISLSEDESIQHDFEVSCKKHPELIGGISSMVIRGLSVMNCSNVKCVDNQPPTTLNKKRIKSGKVPLFSYKTLHLSIGDPNQAKNRNHDKSERNGPRLHLRRGHIRRLAPNKTTWVQACMVGDKSRGVVMKDYYVTQSQPQTHMDSGFLCKN